MWLPYLPWRDRRYLAVNKRDGENQQQQQQQQQQEEDEEEPNSWVLFVWMSIEVWGSGWFICLLEMEVKQRISPLKHP